MIPKIKTSNGHYYDDIDEYTDEAVIKLCFFNSGTFNYKILNKIDKRPNLTFYLENRFNDSKSIEETLYRIYNHIEERPVCIMCGKPVEFSSCVKFHKCCSEKCFSHYKRFGTEITDEMIIKALFKYTDDCRYIKKCRYKNIINIPIIKNYILNRFEDTKDLEENIYRILYKIDKIPISNINNQPMIFKSFEKGYTHSFLNRKELLSKENKEQKKQYLLNEYLSNITSLADITKDVINYISYSDIVYIEKFHKYIYELLKMYCKSIHKNSFKSVNESLYRIRNDIAEIPKSKETGKDLTFVDSKSYRRYKEYKFTGIDSVTGKTFVISKRIKSLERIKNKTGYDISFEGDDYNVVVFKNVCSKHSIFKLQYNEFKKRCYNGHVKENICPICNQNRKSHQGLEKKIQSILKHFNVQYTKRCRTANESGKEIDIYLFNYKIGIECNGSYWHSTSYKKYENTKCHYENKFINFKNDGIRILSFWENDINKKIFQIQYYLRNILCNPNYDYINITVKEIQYNEYLLFAKTYSFLFCEDEQFFKYIGVYNDGVLIYSAALNLEDDIFYIIKYFGNYELCNDNLIKYVYEYIRDNYEYEDIFAYSRNDLSDGSELTKIGFSLVNDYNDEMFYVICSENSNYKNKPTKKKSLKCYSTGVSLYKYTGIITTQSENIYNIEYSYDEQYNLNMSDNDELLEYDFEYSNKYGLFQMRKFLEELNINYKYHPIINRLFINNVDKKRITIFYNNMYDINSQLPEDIQICSPNIENYRYAKHYVFQEHDIYRNTEALIKIFNSKFKRIRYDYDKSNIHICDLEKNIYNEHMRNNNVEFSDDRKLIHRIGLYINDELICCAGYQMIDEKCFLIEYTYHIVLNNTELLQLLNNYTIVKYHYKTMGAYCNNDYSDGEELIKVGFCLKRCERDVIINNKLYYDIKNMNYLTDLSNVNNIENIKQCYTSGFRLYNMNADKIKYIDMWVLTDECAKLLLGDRNINNKQTKQYIDSRPLLKAYLKNHNL